MRKFIYGLSLFILPYSNLLANIPGYTISLDQYRTKGIANLEREMDIKLTSKDYWSEYLKNKDTKFGFIEEYSSVLTCNKEKSTLTLFNKDSNEAYEFKKEHNAYTGKNKGDKLKEGDQRTPVGIYKIVDTLSKETNLDPFYGPLAFVTSYPNTYDTYLGKNGHGIWIHGLPTEQARDEYTRGCIAIQNSNIECLGKNINVNNTLLIIGESDIEQNISKDILASILSELYKWRYAWLYNDIEGYLSFYAKDFVRYDGVLYERFKNYKTRVFKKIEKKTIIFQDINIIPYPNTKDIYQITFKEYYKSDSFEFSGDKTLMIRIKSNEKIEIFTEK